MLLSLGSAEKPSVLIGLPLAPARLNLPLLRSNGWAPTEAGSSRALVLTFKEALLRKIYA